MNSYFDLSGQVAVVTGCSTGLGVQMARALASQGARIVAVARRRDKIEAVAKEMTISFSKDISKGLLQIRNQIVRALKAC